MRAFNFYNENVAIGEIDIVLDVQMTYQTLKKRAVSFKLHDVNVPTVSIQDLIELKRLSGRKQDISDIEHLKIILDK
jgi:predicted nucleotidyltransferase